MKIKKHEKNIKIKFKQRGIEDIKIALENVKQGKVNSIEQVAKELGIILR